MTETAEQTIFWKAWMLEFNFCRYERSVPTKFGRCAWFFLHICFCVYNAPVWKMVNTWPKKILCYPLSKIGVFEFLISWIFRKKNKEIKKSWFLVNSRCFCFAFHANLMSDGKKKRLKFLFITPLILLINMSISLFRWTV